MSGLLTIRSTGGQGILSGHSWVEYQPDGGETTTYGTWGNNPRNLGNGLHENLDKGNTAGVSRTVRLDDAQEQRLLETISKYRSKGEDGWVTSRLAPPSPPMRGARQAASTWIIGPAEPSATPPH